jgi:two-component system, OmpR family, sensor kinase
VTLRRRLIVTMAILVALGLAAVDIITLSSLHSYLYGRADAQLDGASDLVVQAVLHADERGVPVSKAEIQSRVSPDVYVEILNAEGQVMVSRPSGTRSQADPPPELPSTLPVRPALTADQVKNRGTYQPDANSVTVPSTLQRGPEYRLQATALPGGTLVVATRLDSVNATLMSLRDIELAVSLSVVAALMVLTTVLIRRGLRPLEVMTVEADTIAAGDLSRRVEPSDSDTEVGRLGRALNGMLSQIEAAFEQQALSEERLRRFLADASHELRTPLTSIRGYAELLRKGALHQQDDRDRALARIESEAARMGDLVEDLLTLARLDEVPRPATHRVDLVPVVLDAVSDALTVDRSRSITITAPGPVPVAGDEQRLGQLIHNLLGNALTHTPHGTPVSVSVVAESGRARLRVADRGPGMEPEEAAQVFDRFYRGGTAQADGGSGLGLFIVAAVARSLGGRASVETAVGQGATFEVVLPLWGSDPVAEVGDRPATSAGPGISTGPAHPASLGSTSVGAADPSGVVSSKGPPGDPTDAARTTPTAAARTDR